MSSRLKNTGECQKVALEMGSIRPKPFLPKEIGTDAPPKRCHKVPFFWSGKAPRKHIETGRASRERETYGLIGDCP
jgi:hypothetical protein